MTPSYLINGKLAQGEDFIRAIDALPTDDDDFICIQIPDKGEVTVLRFSEGFLIDDRRADGSTWVSPTLTADRAKDLVRAFLEDRPYWRDGIEWELTTLTRKDVWLRLLRIAVISSVLLALAWWLTRLFTD